MFKKLFDWTPRDVSQWENIRKKGLRHFIVWYGVVNFGGVLFVFLGGAAFLGWYKAVLEYRVAKSALAMPRFTDFVLELGFVAIVCLVGGLINSLVTWAIEEHIYRSHYQRREKD